jgi:hypothetical protein
MIDGGSMAVIFEYVSKSSGTKQVLRDVSLRGTVSQGDGAAQCRIHS